MNENLNPIKRLGIYTADRLTAAMGGLIFRSQLEGSTGLNAHLEILSEDNPSSNKIVGLKIFTSDEAVSSARGYTCSGDAGTAAFWFQHSLPVVVMVYEQDKKKILWEVVTADKLEAVGKGWEILIPFENEYGTEEAKTQISELTCSSPYLARLALDKAWIELINEGREVFLELDEWINRPSAEGILRLCVEGQGGGIYQWPFQTSPDMPHVFRLPSLFPWAALSVDENFYRAQNLHDPEQNLLVPYTVDAGEIARFRFKISLNELGRAFLLTEPFICRGTFPDTSGKITGFGNEYEGGLKFQLYNKK